MRTKPITLIFCLLLGSGLNAHAEHDAAYAALLRKDLAAALPLLEEAAALNDPRATSTLGYLYLHGLGVPKDEARALQWYEKGALAGNTRAMNLLATAYIEGKYSAPKDMLKARAWAEKSAERGNDEGQYLYYITVLMGPEWNYRDPAGGIDAKKYALLAGRSMQERELDQKAHVMLALSATQGNQVALNIAISYLLDKSGPGSRDRALALINAAPPAIASIYSTAKKNLLDFKKYGESYTSLKVFRDTMKSALPMAMLHVSDTCEPIKNTTFIKHSVSRPLSDARYLPVDALLMKNTYLVSGNWEELWQFRVCGIDVAVPISFQADGFAGTTMQLTSCVLANPAPLDVPGAPTDCSSKKAVRDISVRMNEKGDLVPE